VEDRETLGERLKATGIPTAVYYPKCLHEQPVYSSLGYKWGDYPEAERASRKVISLPMHPLLSDVDQDAIVQGVKSCL
jgi:UDP-2-acetamido-2-deoxy-ribo-hexuluronate aminotransferase